MEPSRTAKTRQENEETATHSRTASPKDRHKSLFCSQKTERKGPDAGRTTVHSLNDKTGEFVDRKEDLLIQLVITHENNIN